LHARTIGAVVSVDLLLLLSLRLLLCLRLILSRVSAPGHGSRYGADPGAGARITGDGADRCATHGAARRTLHSLPTTPRGAGGGGGGAAASAAGSMPVFCFAYT
jgi:hypothetical protein